MDGLLRRKGHKFRTKMHNVGVRSERFLLAFAPSSPTKIFPLKLDFCQFIFSGNKNKLKNLFVKFTLLNLRSERAL